MGQNDSDMDNLSTHCEPYPRRYPGALRVSRIGYVARKRVLVDHAFGTWNFSFVLSGHGRYQHEGVEHELRAPCVLTQWPGPRHVYGPDEWWEELFLIYPPDAGETLRRMGIDSPRRPFWHLAEAGGVRTALRELSALVQDAAGNIDRIDRCCERMLLESLLAARPRPVTGPMAEVLAIRHEVEMGWRDEHDFGALARARGLSPTHFRRLWNRQVGCPPQRHLIRLRLREACRQLVEGDRQIADIARSCGFADPLYFARRFRSAYGMSASAYRQLYAQGAG